MFFGFLGFNPFLGPNFWVCPQDPKTGPIRSG
jgi:hypothetical protein